MIKLESARVKWTSSILFSTLFLLTFFFTACSVPPKIEKPTVQPVVQEDAMRLYNPTATNSPEAQQKPYVVMVSIDGYRHDYNQIHKPPNLIKIAEDGVAARSLRPVYPSKTFPNHYSLVTGLYADQHGIVSNEFFDPSREATYALKDRAAVEDGTWYQGEPLWNAVQKQGMLSASYFWVGSEANVQGMHPNYYYRYNQNTPNAKRVDQVLEWLKMPPDRRPHLIMLYFSDVDSAGHEFGPLAEQTREAVLKVDAEIGRLREGLEASGLPVNLIVVSDHGMEKLDPTKAILIDEPAEVAALMPKFKTLGRGPQMFLYLNKGEDEMAISEMEAALKKTARNFRVHRRVKMRGMNFSDSPRGGDLVIDPDLPYSVGVKSSPPYTNGGNHGWNPTRYESMHGVFFALGPAFKKKAKIPSFENIHVYPLVINVLGLELKTQIDGRLSVSKAALRP